MPFERTPAQQRAARLVLPFIVLMTGALLLAHYGKRFVFYYADTYTTISLVALILFTPFVLYRMLRAPALTEQFSSRYPTNWLRKGVVMPLAAALTVGMVLAAPLGWLFAAAAWSGGAVHYVPAKATKVGTYTRSKHCDQTATLRFASADKDTCLDGLYAPASMHVGQDLDVGIRVYPFGFLIVSIAAPARESHTPLLTNHL